MAHVNVKEIIETLENIQITRFVSAAGVVMMLYDHFLTFDDEVALIWKARNSPTKWLFLFIRYVVPASLIVHMHQLSGLSGEDLPDMFCKIWFIIGTFLGITSIAISNLIVLMRLWVLWENSLIMMRVTLIAFIASQIAAVIIASLASVKMFPLLVWSHQLKICTFSSRANLFGLWVPGIAFELVTFIATYLNAITRPMSSDEKMTKALYIDGFVYFIVLFSLRVTNMVLAIVAPLSLIFLGIFFIWAATTTTTTRLVLNLRRRIRDAKLKVKGQDDDEHELELPELPNIKRKSLPRGEPRELARSPSLASTTQQHSSDWKVFDGDPRTIC